MSTPAPLIRPGISVLVGDVSDLDSAVNLLPGTTLFYSAYPAADGKAGIYTKWYASSICNVPDELKGSNNLPPSGEAEMELSKPSPVFDTAWLLVQQHGAKLWRF